MVGTGVSVQRYGIRVKAHDAVSAQKAEVLEAMLVCLCISEIEFEGFDQANCELNFNTPSSQTQLLICFTHICILIIRTIFFRLQVCKKRGLGLLSLSCHFPISVDKGLSLSWGVEDTLPSLPLSQTPMATKWN
jgi:hypothetical protein